MNIEINTKNKTIKILEDCSIKELNEFFENFNLGEDYKIMQFVKIEYIYPPLYSTSSGDFKLYNSSGNTTTLVPGNVTYTSSN